MSTQFPLISENIRLRAEAECVVCFDRENDTTRYLNPSIGLVLALCDGRKSLEELTEFIKDAFKASRTQAKQTLEKIFRDFGDLIKLCDVPSPRVHKIDPSKFVYNSKIGSRCVRSHVTENGWPTFSGPYSAVLSVTRRCNLNCKYCYKAPERTVSRELSTNEMMNTIHQLANFPIYRCFVTGGEPFLRRDIVMLLETLLDKDINPYVSTNGVCIDAVTAEELARINLPTIQVSLDTHLPKIFDQMCGVTGKFAKVISGINNLVSAGVHVRTKCVLTSLNIPKVEDYVRFCHSLGVNYVGFSDYNPGCEGANTDRLFVPNEKWSELVEVTRALQNEFAGEMFVEEVNPTKAWPDGDVIVCGAGISTLTVFSDGNVGICELLENDPQFILGNIRYNSLEEIWKGLKAKSWRNMKTENVSEDCKSCPELLYCRTGCLSMSKVWYEDYFAPDPRCSSAQPITGNLIYYGENNPAQDDKQIV